MKSDIKDFDDRALQNIAIFRALQLGDMLCIIPAVRAIKEAYPRSRTTLIGLPWQTGFVKRFHHYFSDFIEFPGWPGLPEREFTIPDVMRFLDEVQQRRFDLILQMQGEGNIANPMCMLWGAKKVAGLRREGSYCPDKKLFPVMTEREHEVTRFLRLAEAIGAPSNNTELEFPFLEEEVASGRNLLTSLGLSPGRYICIHPGARDPRRRWAPKNFAYAGEQLASKGYSILLTGSEEERDLLRQVESLMRIPVINLVERAGHVDIGELAVLISYAGALVSNDTGVSHIATALKVPSVIIFSPYSDPQRWAPLDRERHVAIPFDQTGDVSNVIRIILRHLEKTGNHSTLPTTTS
jgi:ADP-heptose:LPS heptosyltransferase